MCDRNTIPGPGPGNDFTSARTTTCCGKETPTDATTTPPSPLLLGTGTRVTMKRGATVDTDYTTADVGEPQATGAGTAGAGARNANDKVSRVIAHCRQFPFKIVRYNDGGLYIGVVDAQNRRSGPGRYIFPRYGSELFCSAWREDFIPPDAECSMLRREPCPVSNSNTPPSVTPVHGNK